MKLTLPFPTPSIDKLLAKYKTERRRKRMRPIYTAMQEAAISTAKPEIWLERFRLDQLDELAPYTAEGTEGYFLGLCTLGAGLDEKIHLIGQEDIAAAAVIEEVALAMIVTLTNGMRATAAELVTAEGLKVGPAYRPGVGRWPIELQTLIFTHLPTEEIGVTLSEFMVMSPSKSTSVIVPVVQVADSG